MNTSHTSTLTAEQLEAFLEGKLSPEETKRVQHLLDDCELSKEALEGYSMVPGAFADVDLLKKSIAKQSGMTSLNWSTIGLSVVIIGVVAALIAAVYPTDEKPVVAQQPQPQQQTYSLSVPAPEHSLSPNEDHFVNPEAVVVAVNIPKNTVTSTGDTITKIDFSTEVLQPIPLDANRQPLVDTVPVVPKVMEREEYNAQVGFLLDLKITEFDRYYKTQTIEVKDLPLTGTPADRENADDGGPVEEETTRAIPADQFLREGLIAFRDGRYGKCIGKMEVLLQHDKNDINALFYTAVSYVKLEMYSKAIPLLDQILEDPNNVFDEEALWYKALALDANGDAAAAQVLFRQITDKGGFYAEQAKRKLR
jgi:hypothetical protein